MSKGSTWRYVAPNVVTCLGLLLGMFSVSASLGGHYMAAGWFVIMGVLFDKLDGSLARKLGGSSAFGEQMDSLSDLVTFGVAPTVLFLSFLRGHPELGEGLGSWFVVYAYAGPFLYTVAGALRLARFNVNTARYGDEYFFGTPIPMSGSLLVLFLMVFEKYEVASSAYLVLPALYVLMAVTMVTRFPLPKLKPVANPFLNALLMANVAVAFLLGLTWFLLPVGWQLPEYFLASIFLYLGIGGVSARVKGVRAPC